MNDGQRLQRQFQDALALHRAGRLAEAERLYRAVLAAAPEAVEPRACLGDVLRGLGRPREAMALYGEAVARDPHLKAVCRDTDRQPTSEARCQTVLENCRHILARYPHYADAHHSQALALLNFGRTREARLAAQRAAVLNPTVPAYYHVILQTGDVESNAPAVSALSQLAAQEDALDEEDRIVLHFQLAKAHDSAEDYDRAFAHMEKGNAVKRRGIAYDEAKTLDRMRAIAEIFSPERMRAMAGAGHDSEVPVFVVGMLRSGTSLVEQILASHPSVYGAGELDLLDDVIAARLNGAPHPEGCAHWGAADWRGLGEAYVSKLSLLSRKVARVVDKMPCNFLHAGLIALALPRARIVHVRRDPLDTCFSCYGLVFAGHVGFVYDQGELGRYYRAYDALMAHWRTALPEGAMLELDYEALVDDLPGQARRLIEYCGLTWDARCLDFHKTERVVSTASLCQVRQPVYRKSVGRAGNYARHLGPLRKALGLQ